MLKSIYKELLEFSEQQASYNAIQLDGFYTYDAEDGYIDEDSDVLTPPNGGVNEEDDNLIYMPLERTFLCAGDDIQIDVENVCFANLNFPIPESALKEYMDADLFRNYPIAVSFDIPREAYICYAKELVSKDKALIAYSNGACHAFEDGVQVFDLASGDGNVKLIMGFAREAAKNFQLAGKNYR